MKVKELTLEKKCEAVGETAMILDKEGKSHEVYTFIYPAWIITSIVVEDDLPICSASYLNGKLKGEWCYPEYQDNKELLRIRKKVWNRAKKSGIFDSDCITGLINSKEDLAKNGEAGILERENKLYELGERCAINEKEIWTPIYTAWVIATVCEGKLIASLNYLESGEHRTEWRVSEFRGSKGLLAHRLRVIRRSILAGLINPLGDYIFGLINPNNLASVKYFQRMGSDFDEVELHGQKWIQGRTHITKFLVEGGMEER